MGRAGISEDKLRAFAEAYVTTNNATQAAREAGYQGKSKVVSETARKLLKRADVQQMVEDLRKEVSEHRKATRDERQAWWTKVMLGEPIPQWIKGRRVLAPAPASVQAKASELLGKSEGDFVKKHLHLHSGEVRIVARAELPDNGRAELVEKRDDRPADSGARLPAASRGPDEIHGDKG